MTLKAFAAWLLFGILAAAIYGVVTLVRAPTLPLTIDVPASDAPYRGVEGTGRGYETTSVIGLDPNPIEDANRRARASKP